MNEIRQGDIFRIETISKCIKRANSVVTSIKYKHLYSYSTYNVL